MTMKEMFKKIEVYNEIAEMIGTTKAKIALTSTKNGFTNCEETFKTYKEFTKFVKDEYFPDVAENLIKSKEWEMGGEITFNWGWDNDHTSTFGAELTC